MHREWPFFRSLIDNAQLGLGRSDRAVARLYAGLVDPAELRERVFGAMLAEWDRGGAGHLRGHGRRRSCWRTRRSCAAPSACATPTSIRMSFVQVTTLRRLRAAGATTIPQRDAVRDLVALCVNGDRRRAAEHGLTVSC